MPDETGSAQEHAALAGQVRSALESGDPNAIRDLLAPRAKWGAPESDGDDGRSREEIVAWWSRAQAAGARVTVTEMTTGPGKLLLGLDVTGIPAAREAGGSARRWQVLTVRDGYITDIRGFGNRAEAAARADLPG